MCPLQSLHESEYMICNHYLKTWIKQWIKQQCLSKGDNSLEICALIPEILINSDNEYDIDSEELPPNFVTIESPESEEPFPTDKVSGHSVDAGGDGGRPTVGEV